MPELHPVAEVLVATTWTCNLACSYCFVRHRGLAGEPEPASPPSRGGPASRGSPRLPAGHASPRSAYGGEPMSPALAARVVDALDEGLKHVECICLHLYGGEPLLNLPAVEAMLDRARKKPGRFRFAVTTNGVVPPAALDLLEAGRFQVVLSIDGPAGVHDQCRRTVAGDPTHAAVMRFLGDLRSKTPCLVRGSAVVRSGWGLAQATAYLRTLPVHFIKAQAVRLPQGAPYALTPPEREAYLADLEVLGRQVITEIEAGRPPRDDRFSSRVLQLLQGTSRRRFCGAGRFLFGVTPDGTVLPCVLLDPAGATLGHIRGDPAAWVGAGARWRASRRPRRRCRECPALGLCGGGCPAVMPVCGEDECELVRKNCEVAVSIFRRFRETPETLLTLAGVT